MHLEIKEGALFISDAHDGESREDFHNFLLNLEQTTPYPPQLFLMGDMFELLVGKVDYTKRLFHPTIELLNQLSDKIEIFYMEGNHDFDLETIFPKIKVFPITQQPVLFYAKEYKLLLSHGDTQQGKSYTFYTKVIRNKIILKLLNFIDTHANHVISKKILAKHIGKNICYKIPNFREIIKQKIKKYDIELTEIDFICEGHHHQNQEFVFKNLIYKNFSSFACDKSYYKITLKDEIKFIEFS